MRGRTRRQYREIAKNTRACRRARGMGHLSLATERNIDQRIITHGTVVENQKTGLPATQTVGARNVRASRGAQSFKSAPRPRPSTLETVPTRAYVPGGSWRLPILAM